MIEITGCFVLHRICLFRAHLRHAGMPAPCRLQ
jgi:hypothetical protein